MAARHSVSVRIRGKEFHILTDRDEQILLGLADHAAVAINNARLFADNAARRQEAEALAELASAIASSLEIQKILSFVVDRACALLGTQRSAVALMNPDQPGAPWDFVATRGMSRAFQALRPKHPRDGTTPAAIAELRRRTPRRTGRHRSWRAAGTGRGCAHRRQTAAGRHSPARARGRTSRNGRSSRSRRRQWEGSRQC